VLLSYVYFLLIMMVRHVSVVVMVVMMMEMATGQILFPGTCPTQATIASFDSTKYLGTWYEYEKYFALFEFGGRCISATYTANTDGSLGVANKQRKILTNQEKTINGRATFVGANTEAKLSVSFTGVPSFLPDADGNYWVLDTDYTSWAIVWSCQNLLFSNAQILWVLTRDRSPAASIITAARAIITGRGLNVAYLKPTDQNGC